MLYPKKEAKEFARANFKGIWAAALEYHKDEAIAATDEENYNRYMKYLTGCQYYFLDEAIDVSLVTYLKPGAAA